VQSRSGSYYYVDNNSIPSFGGRLALTIKLGDKSDLTIGASGMAGTFDPKGELWYMIFGGDISLRVGRTTLRAEWLARRQQYDPDSFALRYAVDDDDAWFMKQGAYVELEQPLTPNLDLIVRADGMVRAGDVPVDSPLDHLSAVGRATVGIAVLAERHLRFKASSELWEFTDPDVNGVKTEFSFHLGAVATF